MIFQWVGSRNEHMGIQEKEIKYIKDGTEFGYIYTL